MSHKNPDPTEVRSQLTIEHFVFASDRQAGILCGYTPGNGHHLNYSSPTLPKLQSLAQWYGGDLQTAINAVSARQDHWQKMKRMKKDRRIKYKASIALKKRALCAEIEAAIELRREAPRSTR